MMSSASSTECHRLFFIQSAGEVLEGGFPRIYIPENCSDTNLRERCSVQNMSVPIFIR